VEQSTAAIDGFELMRSLFIGLWLAAMVHAQAPAPRPFKIVRLDPALDAIISTDAKIETLGEHFGLTEGPVWIQHRAGGYLLFSDCAANDLQMDGGARGVSRKERLHGHGQQGRLIVTQTADRTVTRLEKDGRRTILADRYEGKRLSGPNDVVVKSDGAIYFTDSVNGLRGGAMGPLRKLLFNGRKVSPRNCRIRQNPALGGAARRQYRQSKNLQYGRQRQLEDRLERKSLFRERSGSWRGLDHIAGGKASGTLQLPQIQGEPRPRICASNLAFGDADNKGLFITACASIQSPPEGGGPLAPTGSGAGYFSRAAARGSTRETRGYLPDPHLRPL
jgi:hypothetical protein